MYKRQQSSYSHYSGINYSALEVAVRRIQQDFDFLMRYLPKPVSYTHLGKTATADQAQEVCAQIRKVIGELYGDAVAQATTVL